VRIALLAPSIESLPYSLHKLLPALLHAVRHVQQSGILSMSSSASSKVHLPVADSFEPSLLSSFRPSAAPDPSSFNQGHTTASSALASSSLASNASDPTPTNSSDHSQSPQSIGSSLSPSIDFRLFNAHFRFRVYYRNTNCSSSVGPLAAFDFYTEQSVHAFFGPFCDYVLAPVTRYSSSWNIPVLTTAGQNDNFDSKRLFYPILTRMNGSYTQMGSLLLQILHKFQWTVIAMLFHNNRRKQLGNSACYFKLGAIFAKLQRPNAHYHDSFDETDPATDYEQVLRSASKNARSEHFLIFFQSTLPFTVVKIRAIAVSSINNFASFHSYPEPLLPNIKIP
jgi:hypothetical protein